MENIENIKCYIIVKTKCRGSRTECSERINRRLSDNLKEETSNISFAKGRECGNVLDYLGDKFLSSVIFNFHTLPSNDKFSFDFETSSTNFSEKINAAVEIDGIKSSQDTCNQRQCEAQHNVLNFVLELDPDKNECGLLGINCNPRNLVTKLWLSEFFYFI